MRCIIVIVPNYAKKQHLQQILECIVSNVTVCKSDKKINILSSVNISNSKHTKYMKKKDS